MLLCVPCSRACDDTHRFCPNCGAALTPEEPGSRADAMIGRTLPGGYRVQHLVGIGGMGRVYVAEQTALARTVAVKVIHPHLIGDEHAAGRFITEARASSRLSHPNSIAIYDFGKTSDGQLYLVMEYLRGRDLARVLDEEGPIAIPRALRILRQVLAALEEAHELLIVHRDLKPENIVLEPRRDGREHVKVVDYGLAKIHESKRGDVPVTAPGFVCGTPEYMSPEQARGEALDARSDVYSMGVLLYQLLTGRLPFEGETGTRVLLAHLTQPAPDPRVTAPARMISDDLAEVVLRAMAKDKEARFPSASAFIAALGAHEDGVASGPVSGVGRPKAGARCTACDAWNTATQKFCGECGAALPQECAVRRTPPMPGVSSKDLLLAGHSGRAEPRRESPPVPGTRLDTPRARAKRELGELPFTGRVAELSWLDAQRDLALVMPACARLTGAAGAGKTRLLLELAGRSAKRGDSVVYAAPDPSGVEVSGHLLRDVIARLVGGSPFEWGPEGEAARRGIADLFAKVLPAPPALLRASAEEPVSPTQRRVQAAAALRWAVVDAAERAHGGTTVVLIDDLECVDGFSKNAFLDVFHEPPATRVMLLLAYSSSATIPGLASASAAPGEELALKPLPPSTCGRTSRRTLRLRRSCRSTSTSSRAGPARATRRLRRR